MEVKNVKGTKDLYGEEVTNFNYIEGVMSSVSSLFGFKEMRPPVLEHSEVFVRGVGEGSDVVRKEMYTFLDKGERSLTLRPEFTAGIMRLIVQNKLYATEPLPIKAFYMGPVFRYERPQLGRYRQFNQFGVECVGGSSLYHDVEVILLGYCILNTLGLENVTLKINTLGDDESRNNYRQALKDFFKDKIEGMCEDCKSRYEINPLRILDCKVPEDQEIVKDAPKMMNYLSLESKQRFDQVLGQLEMLNIPFEVDDNLVRGLDYYSETVFEFHYTSKKGVNYGAIGAGGHYDKLIAEFGGPELPGVGFSFGIERVASILKDDELNIPDENVMISILPMKAEYNSQAAQFALSLRLNGYSAEVNYDGGKVASMIKRAVRIGAKVALIIGEDEVKNGTIVVKNLESGEQQNVELNKLNEALDAILQKDECDDPNCGCHEHEDDECCHEHHHHDGECCHHQNKDK